MVIIEDLLKLVSLTPKDKANILLTAKGVKPGGDFSVREKAVSEVKNILSEFNLHFRDSRGNGILIKFPEDINRAKVKEFATESNAYYIFYFTKEFSNFELLDENPGKFYGYPECCIRKFEGDAYEGETITLNYDPIEELSFIYHAPCFQNFSRRKFCMKSILLGRLYRDVVKSESKALYHAVLEEEKEQWKNINELKKLERKLEKAGILEESGFINFKRLKKTISVSLG